MLALPVLVCCPLSPRPTSRCPQAMGLLPCWACSHVAPSPLHIKSGCWQAIALLEGGKVLQVSESRGPLRFC